MVKQFRKGPRPTFRPVSSTKNQVQKLKKDLNKLKKVATPEVKVHDTDVTNSDIGTALEITPVSLIAQGDDDSSRDGDQILGKKLYIRGFLFHDTDTGGTDVDGVLVRCMLVQDMEQAPNASIFTATDLLQANNLESHYQSDTDHQRFRVLYDKVHYLGPKFISTASSIAYASGVDKKMIVINKKIDKKMYFNGTASTQASAGKGKLYWCMMIDDQGANGTVSFNGTSRLTFQDS